MQMLFINFSAAGIPIRTTMDNSTTVQYAGLFHQLTSKARNTVRDIDPQVWNVFVLFSKFSKGNLFFVVSMVAVYVKRCLKVFANYGWKTVFA